MPKIHELINANPLLGALPSAVLETLVSFIKETMKPRNATLYEEDCKPNGVWLISNGVVKWSSKSTRNKHLFHPTFTHGSTLGLYEVLTGKPYICDIVTDSAVLCLYIEAEKISTALRYSPGVEDFFWRESTIMLFKILLPQAFEESTIHELRALVTERSSLRIYIIGETFEIPQHSVGLLLEGFVKCQGFQEELLTSPAVLCPSHVDSNLQRSETSGAGHASCSYQAYSYQVETRARVIVCDIAEFETIRTPSRRPSSLLSPSIDRPSGSSAIQHSGLMSWPAKFYESRQQKNDLEKADGLENNLSARAIQLGILGSMG